MQPLFHSINSGDNMSSLYSLYPELRNEKINKDINDVCNCALDSANHFLTGKTSVRRQTPWENLIGFCLALNKEFHSMYVETAVITGGAISVSIPRTNHTVYAQRHRGSYGGSTWCISLKDFLGKEYLKPIHATKEERDKELLYQLEGIKDICEEFKIRDQYFFSKCNKSFPPGSILIEGSVRYASELTISLKGK